ncbi:hypothetical protein T265_01768 [Opisthorchis viverrini]|uniref:Uncharacterized protein n=1 Tax=Opisthorchis viverrini TaxID=6198 RepID=A0A074ZYN4_OPIVI|nr:hypothetical protein T265_01768 [Opisthorchis viverrini]KER32151.1 hypothetical protein T265_01768 [Opisthorchis viverrini]
MSKDIIEERSLDEDHPRHIHFYHEYGSHHIISHADESIIHINTSQRPNCVVSEMRQLSTLVDSEQSRHKMPVSYMNDMKGTDDLRAGATVIDLLRKHWWDLDEVGNQ